MVWDIQARIATQLNDAGCKYSIEQKVHTLQFTKQCICCADRKYCLKAIASVLLLLDLDKPVTSVSSSVENFGDQTLVSPTFMFSVGLCCAHDWTEGTGPMSFDAVVQGAAKHDDETHVVIVTDKAFATQSSKCRFIYLT